LLSGNNILIRPVKETDRDKILSWRKVKDAPPFMGLLQVSPLLGPVNLFFRPWLKNYIVEDNAGNMTGVIRLDVINRYKGSLGISMDFCGDAQNSAEALKLMSTYILNELGYSRVSINVLVFEKTNIAMLKKLGFAKEIVLKNHAYYNGLYHDVLVYALTKGD